jgi:hypothetical protein
MHGPKYAEKDFFPIAKSLWITEYSKTWNNTYFYQSELTVLPLQYLCEVHIHYKYLNQGVKATGLSNVVQTNWAYKGKKENTEGKI